jgi:release factor glutamine methyltransferase
MNSNFFLSLVQQLYPTYTLDRAHAEQVALWLCEKVSRISPALIRIESDTRLTHRQKEEIAELINRLIKEDYPLQYLLGSVPFCGLTLAVEPPLLIPRPETEEWVLRLVERIQRTGKSPRTILDLCTGTGCIALALAQAFPQARVVGVDNNPEAVACAQRNSALSGVAATFIHSDLYNALDQQVFDLIVANPPYIDEKEWHLLESRVRNFEDRGALIADDQGYALLERIIQYAPQYLDPAGLCMLVVEIGATQATRVLTYATSKGATAILDCDSQNLPRTITNTWHTKKHTNH